MTTTAPPAPTSTVGTPGTRRADSALSRLVGTFCPSRVIVILIAVVGIAVLVYPAAGQWLTAREQSTAVYTYTHVVEGMEPQQISDQLAQAHAYNDSLDPGPIMDPYASVEPAAHADPAYDAYLAQLNVNADGVMGYLNIPSISVTLPIYHGTAAQSLNRGVGHLYDTALPVGGPGTHSILTGHSGVANAELLTHLIDLQVGDLFTISVLDQDFTYRVDKISVVLPSQTSALQAIPGKDYVTLGTCTPLGINSHRLLVRGERLDVADPGQPDQPILASPAQIAGFPWWILAGVGGLLVAIIGTRWVTTPPHRRVRDPHAGH